MTPSSRFAAVDLGASSGRVVVGEVGPDRLDLVTAIRFANEPVRTTDGLHWDLDALLQNIAAGLDIALDRGSLTSVGVDSWGVDYGLLLDGELMAPPFHYRDELRLLAGPRAVDATIGAEELFARNGLQRLAFNTVYQLAADAAAGLCDGLLMMPDLVTYLLTGVRVAERTAASTTGLLGVHTREWDTDLMASLGIKADLFEPLVDPGHRVGELLPPVSGRGGGSIPVVAVGSHDTASAVVGVPLLVVDGADDPAYVSLGTWALAGLELDEPVLTPEARAASFSNEGGVDGTIRFLTNVMGTWLLSETLRAWGETDLAGMLTAAEAHAETVPVVDVQDPRFLPPGDMEARIRAWCAEHDVPAPDGRVAVVRCIVESIAAAISTAIERAGSLAGRRVGVVHVVGGGAQNALLCQAIASRSGRPVLAGPVEATAVGNVLVQARTAGVVGPTLADLRAVVARTFGLARYDPRV